MLFSTPELDTYDTRVLAEIDRMRDELRHRLAEPRRWFGQLRRNLTAAAVRGSTYVEGYRVSIENARALVSGEEMAGNIPEDTVAAVTGYRDTLTWVQQAAHIERFGYHEMMLSILHFTMVRHEMTKWPGRYRAGDIYVTGPDPINPVYTGPPAEQVPDLMAELVEWLNTGDLGAPPLVRAAMAHLNLVSIHPWRDGNGRMSRCLHTLVLARDKILAPEFSSIEEWIGDPHNTARYYDALASTQHGSWDPHGDTREWVRFVLRAHHRQAQSVERRFSFAGAVWRMMEQAAEAKGFDERTVSALYAAATAELRRTTYQQDESLTRDQAIRDIQKLGHLGLIESVGRGRHQRYVLAGDLREQIDDTIDSFRQLPLVEPYDALKQVDEFNAAQRRRK